MKVAIIGGGIAGLFTAWYLVKQGVEVTIFEKEKVGQGTTWWAAGMLAPINELEFNELELLRAGVKSREMYATVAEELGEVGLDPSGTLEVALTQDDVGYLRRLYEYQKEQGLQVEWLSGGEACKLEPYLASHIPNAIWSSRDIQVDNRKLVHALATDLKRRGVEIREKTPVDRLIDLPELALWAENRRFAYDKIVVTTGVWPWEGGELPYRVYPVRGELVILDPPRSGFLKKTVRIWNKVLGRAYIVPKSDRIVLGATSEEKGFEQTNTAGGLLDILRKAYAAVPGIYELNVKQVQAAFRPSTLNRQPILDKEPNREVYHLNGLYRHGVLLGPLVGKAMADLVLTGKKSPEVQPFGFPES